MRRLRGLRFLLGLSTLITNFSWGAIVPTPRHTHAPYTPQEIVMLPAGLRADDRIDLMLTNNRPDVLPVQIDVYTTDGRKTALDPIQMNANETRDLTLDSDLLAGKVPRNERLGWLKIKYAGALLELGAQLTLYPTVNHSGLDAPRSLSVDFLSGTRDAVAWLPRGASAHLALTNVSSSPLTVKLDCSGREAETVAIDATQTLLRDYDSSADLPAGGQENTFFCHITEDGAIDALRATGYVATSDSASEETGEPAKGYAAPIRFYDPAGATFSNLTALDLDTARHTRVAIRNLTLVPVSVTPLLRPVSSGSAADQSGGIVQLDPGSAGIVDIALPLQALKTAGVMRATLTVQTSAPLGALVGDLVQITPGSDAVQDIPLRTSNAPAFNGGMYPLRWDQDFTNLPAVTNTTERPLSLRAFVTAGGVTYVFPKSELAPGETATWDVDAIRRGQVPDFNGKKIPETALYGQFHWQELSMGHVAGLLGRNQLTSFQNRRTSSFSCGLECGYNNDSFPYFDPGFWSANISGSTADSSGTEQYQDAYGNWISGPIPGTIFSYTNQSVSSVADQGNGTYLQSWTAGGTTDIDYTFQTDFMTYDPEQQQCNQNTAYTPMQGTATTNPAPCFTQLKYRSILGGEAVHMFWYIQTSSGTQYIVDGGPQGDCSPDCGYLEGWVTAGVPPFASTGIPDDTTSVGVTWSNPAPTGAVSPDVCPAATAIYEFGLYYPQTANGYVITGPNSNTFARWAAEQAGYTNPYPTVPPNAVGW
jgi:hypothetical protein